MSSEQLNHEVATAVLVGQAALDGVTVSEPMALDEPVVDSVAVARGKAEAVTTEYTQCEHGFVRFVLIQGTMDATLQSQCTRPVCVSSAVVPPETVACHVAASIQQSVVSEADDGVYEAKESPHPHDGYTCEDCGSEFVSMDNLMDHNCTASGNASVYPPVDGKDEPLCTYQVVYGQFVQIIFI